MANSCDLRSEEYSSLRAEILNGMTMQANLWVGMFASVIALLTFALDEPLERREVFFIVYVVIFVFRLLIQREQVNILRISAYIIVYYEEKHTKIKWEKRLRRLDEAMKGVGEKMPVSSRVKMHMGISNFNYYMASVLGTVTSLFYWKTVGIADYSAIVVVIVPVLLFLFDWRFWDDNIRNAYIKAYEKDLY